MMKNTYYPQKEDFLQLANNGNLLTVYCKILADMETPISAFQKIGKNGYRVFLEVEWGTLVMN